MATEEERRYQAHPRRRGKGPTRSSRIRPPSWGRGRSTVSQIRGSGPTNKDETLMMMGILMLMLMLKVMRG